VLLVGFGGRTSPIASRNSRRLGVERDRASLCARRRATGLLGSAFFGSASFTFQNGLLKGSGRGALCHRLLQLLEPTWV